MAVQWDADNGFNGIAVDVFDAIKNKILGIKNEIPEVSEDISAFFDLIKEGDIDFSTLNSDGIKELTADLGVSDDTLNKFLEDWDGSGDIQEAFTTHLQGSTQGLTLFQRAGKAAGTALKSLGATLGSMVVMWAIGEVISIATTAIDNYANRVKYAKEALDDFNSSTKEQQDDLSSQKTWIDENGKQYEQLAEGVDKYGHNISLTSDEFTEYKNLTKEIAETFPSMVSGYNEQNEAIIKNKGSIEALTKAYEDNQKAYYNDILSKSGDTFNDFKTVSKDELSKKNQLSDLMNNKYSQEQMTGLLENYSSFESVFGKTLGKSLTKELFSALNDEFRHEATLLSGRYFDTIDFTQLSPQLQEKVHSVFSELNQTIDTEADKVRPILQAYLYGQSSGYDQLDDEAKSAVQSFIQNVDSAFFEQFDSDIDMETWITNNVINPLKDGVNNSDLAIRIQTLFSLNKEDFSSYQEYVNAVLAIINQLQTLTDKDGNRLYTDEQINGLKTKFGVGDVDSEGNVSGNKKINAVKDKFKKIKGSDKFIEGLKEDELTLLYRLEPDKVKSLNSVKDMKKQLQSEVDTEEDKAAAEKEAERKRAYQDTVNRFTTNNSKKGDGKAIKDFLKSENIDSQLELEYFNKVTKNAKSAAEAIELYNRAKKNGQSAQDYAKDQSFKTAWSDLGSSDDEALQSTQEDLTALAKAGKLTKEAFHGTSGADKWAESFKELGLSTQDVIDRINQMQNSADQLSSMKTGISGIAEILGQKKENRSNKKTRNVGIGADVLAGLSDDVKEHTKEYEEFCKVLGDGNSDMNTCQNAANKLATAYVNSNNFLAKLDNTTKDYYISELKEMGVANANTVVKQTLAKKNHNLALQKEFVKTKTVSLKNATISEVNEFINEKNYSEKTATALYQLALKKKLVNGTKLNFDSDISQIKAFVKALGGQIYALTALQNWKANQSKLQGMPDDIRRMKKQEYLKDAQKEVNKALKKTEVKPEVSITSTNPSDSGTGSGKSKKTKNSKSKDSKQEIDWIARKLEVLQKAIDTTSGKLQNLFSIKAKKNNINKQITETTKLLNANRKAAKAYTAEANKVKLGGKLKAKVRSGDYDITKYSSKTADKINKYQDLIDKAREAQDAVQDNIASIHDLNQQKLDNITTWYDKLLDRINAITSKFQTKTDLTAKIRGMLGKSETGTTTEYNNTLSSQNNALKTSRNEYNKYNAERKEQRSKLIGDNKSNRKATKEFLERSGLSKKQIAKEMKKFDKKNDLTKELEDFDATTEAQAAKLKENIWSAMSDMLETAQALANVPMEKLNVALDNLDTKFSSLEKSANRASTQLENVGTGLEYLTKLNQSQASIKGQELIKARKTLDATVTSRDAAQNQLIKRGINPSAITDSTSLESVVNAFAAKGDYEGINWATKYLAGISAVDEAYKKVIDLTEDYRDTVDSLAETLVSAEDKLSDKNREQDTKEHDRNAKNWAYNDSTKSQRLNTIRANLASEKSNYESYFSQANDRQSKASAQADRILSWTNFSRGDGYNRTADQQATIQKLAQWAEKVKTFDPTKDDIADFYMSEEFQKQVAQGISEGWMHPDMASYVANANQYLLSSNTAAENGKDAKATYDYETVGQSFKDIFSIITNEADRSVTTVQRNIDAIENSLEDNLLTDKSDSYKQEATNYQTQEDIYNNEVAELKQQLAIAESQGLKKGSDTWNELMDQIHTAEDNAAKAAQSYTEAIVNAFNAVGDVADRKVTEIGKSLSKLDTQISLYEAQGHFITSDFYSSEGDYYQQQQDAQLKKAADLQAELDALMADPNNDIKEYSARWYEMKDKIDEASQSAAECGVKVAEATKNAFDAILQMGEKSREAISRMNDEADFYQDILGRDKTVDDKTGAFTENGVASISLSYEKMTNDMVLNHKIKEQIDAVKARFNNGNNPEYGVEKYNEDMDNLLSQQREAIKNYYDEREAVMSLVQDGFEKQLEYLQKIIDKYKEAMNKASDLRDYQNNVDEATKNIASLEKQLAVIQGNDSEEGRATAQSLQKQLDEAQKNLDDLEWDKKKSDMEEILDNLYEDAQDFVDEKLTQITDSIDQIRDLLPENAKIVSDTLSKIDDAWGTRMSEHFSDAVKLGDYSTITSTIESSAEKIANNVYAVEQALLQRTPAPDSTIDSGSHSGNSGSTGTGSSTSGTTNGSSQNTVTPKPKVASENDLKSIVKKYLINGAIPTYNEESNARKSLDALTYDATGDGTLFSDKLHMSGKIPDSNVPKLLTALGLDKATAMPLSMQIAALESELRKRIKMGGFSKGGIIEQINKQVRSNGDDVIISAKDGEGILTPQQTAMMQKFISEMPSLVSISDIKTPALPVAQNTAKTVNVELGDMHFDLPNVTDTDSFINAWKTDNKMKNFVSDVVAGAVTGDNSKAMRY